MSSADMSKGLTYSKPSNSVWSILSIILLRILEKKIMISDVHIKTGNYIWKKEKTLCFFWVFFLLSWKKIPNFLRRKKTKNKQTHWVFSLSFCLHCFIFIPHIRYSRRRQTRMSSTNTFLNPIFLARCAHVYSCNSLTVLFIH